METQKPLTIQEQQCPQCQTLIPIYEGYTTWCDCCNWNLHAPELPPFDNLFDKLYRSIGQKSSQNLFEQMKKATSLQHTWTPAKILAFLLAGCVHSITLAFIILGIWLSLLGWPSLWGLILGVPCLLLTWVLLPDLPKLSTAPLPREQFPTLYQITDRIAQVLDSPPIDGIVPDFHFNAAFGQFGWKRQRILFLGVPLFSILDGREKVALLGHELAHGVNADPTRSFFIGTALQSLARWYAIVHPRDQLFTGVGPVAIVLLFLRLFSLLLASIIWLWAYALSHLLWRDQQRAEYLADFLAAKVSGTEAQLAVLEKIHLNETFRLSLKIAYLNRDGPNFFNKLQQRVAQVPARELERIRRINQLTRSRLDATHPPTAYRIEFLKAHDIPEANVVLSSTELVSLDQELAYLQDEVQKQLFAWDSHSFRSVFGLSW